MCASSTHTLAGSLIGLITLVVTASGFFTEIEDALNVIWKAPRHESYFYQLLRGRVMSLTLVIGLGFLLLVFDGDRHRPSACWATSWTATPMFPDW